MSARALPAKAGNLFRYLFEQASLGIAVEDLDGHILAANPALCSMLGYTENELAGMSCSEFANPEDSRDDWALFQQLRAGVIDHYTLEKRYKRKDGSPLWGRLNVSLLKQEDRESPLVFAFVENVTEHKLAEEALQQKEKELTETQHQAGIGSWSWDARTDRMIWSNEISLRTGHDPNSPAPKLMEQAGLLTPESWDRLQRSVQDAVQTGTSYELDLELLRPLSGVRWATTRGEPLRDADGQVIGLHGTVQDITAHKLTEQKLARTNDRFRLAMEASKSVGWEWDLKSGQLSWFGDLQSMFGIPSDSFDARVEDFYRRVHPEDQKMVAQAVADARQNRKQYAVEFRVVRPDGTVRWVAARGTFYYETNGDPVRMMGIAVDITDRRRVEEALRENEQRFRLAVQAGRMYAFDWDVLTDVIERSKESADILHCQDTEYDTGRNFAARLHQDDVASYTAAEARLTPENPTYQTSFRTMDSDGSFTWLEETGRASFDAQGKLVRVIGMVADITERKQAEGRLREYEKAVEGSEEMIAVVDREYRYLIANRRFLKLRNLTKEQVVGHLVPEVLNKGVFEEVVKAKLDECFAGNIVRFEMRYTYPEVGERDLFVSYFPIEGAAGVDRAACILQDITERKQAQEALKKSEEKFAKTFQHGPMALTLTSAKDHRYIDVNGAFEQITGWCRDEVIGRTPLDIELWVNPAERYELAKRLLTERSLRNMEFRFRMRDGSIRIGSASAELIELNGEPCMLAMVADATEYKRSQDALRESEARERARVKELEAILDAVPVPVLIAHDAECRHITGNRAASEQLREPRGQNLSQSAPPGERPAFRQIKNGVEISADLLPMQQAAATGKPMYQRELTLLYEDGTTRDEIANAVPLLDEAGKPRGAVGASIDVTQLKRTERALRDSEDKLRLLLDSTAEAIYGIDLEHRCTFCNPAGLRALGYEHVDEVLGKNMHKLIHHTHADGTLFPEEECRIHQVTQTGEGVHAEDEALWRADGTSFPTEYWSYPQRRGEEVVGAVVTFIDITARKLAEAALANVSRKLIEAQEQERTRIGRELHDDIGQRLALLAVELQQLQKDPLIFPRHRNRLVGLHKRASEIAADTQSLSHELHSARLQYLGLAAAIRGFCREFGEQQRVKIDLKIDDLPSPLSAEISLCLFRVLQEALHNSSKHSGALRFEVRLWGTANEIHLTVRDFGKGFDRETAKTSQGIGLISMEERLKLVNGTLSIESQPGSGTTIEARVPVISGIESMGIAG